MTHRLSVGRYTAISTLPSPSKSAGTGTSRPGSERQGLLGARGTADQPLPGHGPVHGDINLAVAVEIGRHGDVHPGPPEQRHFIFLQIAIIGKR